MQTLNINTICSKSSTQPILHVFLLCLKINIQEGSVANSERYLHVAV